MERDALAQDILERFVRYAQVDTQSSEVAAEQGKHPSTDIEWDLLRMLQAELQDLGVKDTELDEHGVLIGRIPASKGKERKPTIGLMAHVDTASDVKGNGVKPQVIERYQGGDVTLPNGLVIAASENPELAQYQGETLVTSDGTTLLGSDDKAGVAEIMGVVKRILADSTIQHGPVEVYFTSDEETGMGMDCFPYDKIRCDFCYTVDGGPRYSIEQECFSAAGVRLHIHGVSYHTGSGRGRIVNAITVASRILSSLPQAESPEATDGRYGFYAPMKIEGALNECTLSFLLRDFKNEEIERRISVMQSLSQAMEAAYPGCKIDVEVKHQYYNMVEEARKKPLVLDCIWQAGKELGMPLYESLIRGGTDGARMAHDRHIPCLNLFTGGHNLHSVYEWAALPAMRDSARLICRILEIGAR